MHPISRFLWKSLGTVKTRFGSLSTTASHILKHNSTVLSPIYRLTMRLAQYLIWIVEIFVISHGFVIIFSWYVDDFFIFIYMVWNITFSGITPNVKWELYPLAICKQLKSFIVLRLVIINFATPMSLACV